MPPNCRIEGELKLGSNQNNETFIWYVPENRWLSMNEFAKCEIGNDVKIVLKIQNEKVKKNASNYPDLSISSFNDNRDYNLYPSSLVLTDMGITKYEEQPQFEPLSTPITPPNPTNLSDLFIGGAATLAMILSVAQQIRQKKKETESSMCCNNNKMEISKFDAKLQKLETEIKAKSEKDNKGMIAEILETRKEIKDIKEEFQSGKEDLQKIIEIIEIHSKNK